VRGLENVSSHYLRNMPYETDAGISARAALGLIVLASDQTIEYEFRRVATLPGVGIYESRIYNAPEVTPETMRALEKEIRQGAGLMRRMITRSPVSRSTRSAGLW